MGPGTGSLDDAINNDVMELIINTSISDGNVFSYEDIYALIGVVDDELLSSIADNSLDKGYVFYK